MDPIHQFQIKNLFPAVQIGPFNIAFTNSALFMVLSVAAIAIFLLGATRSRGLVPGRLQMAAELFYTFMADALRNAAGPDGMAFFPLVFSLFMFILFANLLGLIPFFGFTVTSHIIITVALALLGCSSRSSSSVSGRTACTSETSSRAAFRATCCRWSCRSK